MESLNSIMLAGKVTALDPKNSDSNRAFRFNLTTNQMYVESGEKKLDPEVHTVKLLDHKTFSKYIKAGKHVVLTGRLKYGKDGTYVLGERVHFPGGSND